MSKARLRAALLGATLLSPANMALAQTAPGGQTQGNPATSARQKAAAPAAAANNGLEQIVVTATAHPTRVIKSSVSVSTLTASQLQQLAPASTAGILQNIPGIRSEASGGEGNANIAVRGLPVASGGAKFVQFQEDGMPVLLFGDIAFGTADTWIKDDYNIQSIQVVRGGAASTFASEAPGAVINFIDKTGTVTGGSVGETSGVNYDENRFDFDYGGKIAPGWRGHFGGFYHEGTGPRDLHYTAVNGGQIKGNITHDIDDGNGFIRLNGEYMNDRTPVYLPVPIEENGSGSFQSLPGFNALTGTLQSNGLLHTYALDHNGGKLNTNLSDGYHVKTFAFGGQFHDTFGAWTADDKFRIAFNSGDFVGPYPADVDTAQNLADQIGGAGSTLSYASGPHVGQAITNPGGLNGNGLAVNTVLFDVTIPDFNNQTNQFTLNRKFETDDYGTGDVTVGDFTMVQDLVMDWHWSDYLISASGSNPQLLDVTNAKGQKVTSKGTVANYASGFGCLTCTSFYNTQYIQNAPFAQVTWQYRKFNFDGSIRYDTLHAGGSYQAASGTFADNLLGPGGVPLQTAVADSGPAQNVDYTKNAFEYSFGGNYLITHDLAFFARVSRGTRFNADRALPALPDGNVPDPDAINHVDQQEGGIKFQQHYYNIFVTAFHATTQEYGTDITNTGLFVFSRNYESTGVEADLAAHWQGFAVNAGATYTHSRITADAITPSDVGQAPQRQADWVYQITPSYSYQNAVVGLNIIGTTSSLASQPSIVIMPGYTLVNLFAQYYITPDLRLQFNAENITNAFALTEVDQGSTTPPANHLATGRTYPGATYELGVKYDF